MPLRRRRRLDSTDLTAVSPSRRHRAQHDLELAEDHGEQAPPRTPPDPVTGISVLDALLDKAVAIPSATIHEHVMRLRARNPYASPAQILTLLERQYLLAVSTSGGAVGAVAAAPSVGTGVGIALTTSEVATFFAASSAYSLAVASVYGIEVEDVTRRRTLLLATVLGEQGAQTIGAQTGLGTKAWARSLLVNMPTSTIKQVNRVLTRRMVRNQATRQSALAIGRLAPFGIGAVIGITGARALGRTVITGARRAFGPPPDRFPEVLELTADARDERPAELPAGVTTPDGWRLPGS
ncbi:hypothetical protein OEB99_12375 [Actinotalea sp. M2MS4P-6]|uniref:hypothetical protein n=1 Tax=Actinotalea sp. M2MS4P-6 TaxID=2983762 RepID=UPI0021E3BF8B|nr:hypothetical protein [Actinotalea sp. M2MS4P-6]MCV2395105.1 hypothetical protein [Actinotalea sp. M2MS4P-6]